MLAGLFGRDNGPDVQQALVAYALIVTSLVFGVATISNDNLQDLKTGHLVSATPWRQQVALIIGVVFGSLIVPSVLDLLNTAFGFVGAPNAGPNALSAPQAGLISARSEEHTSELQSLMRTSYAVLCFKKKTISRVLT